MLQSKSPPDEQSPVNNKSSNFSQLSLPNLVTKEQEKQKSQHFSNNSRATLHANSELSPEQMISEKLSITNRKTDDSSGEQCVLGNESFCMQDKISFSTQSTPRDTLRGNIYSQKNFFLLIYC